MNQPPAIRDQVRPAVDRRALGLGADSDPTRCGPDRLREIVRRTLPLACWTTTTFLLAKGGNPIFAAVVGLAGILLYAFLPWPRRGPREYHSPLAAAIFCDIMGAVLALFGVVAMVVPGNAGPVTTIIIAAIAGLAGLAVLALGVWEATFSMALRPNGVRKQTLFRTVEYPYAVIAGAEFHEYHPPQWLGWLLVFADLMVLFTGGPYFPGSDFGPGCAIIRRRDGRKMKLPLSCLVGRGGILTDLIAAGIPADAALLKAGPRGK